MSLGTRTASLPNHDAPSTGGARCDPHPGMHLGRYALLLRLAGGGMADVWIGSHSGPLGFRRFVAVKTIRPELLDNRSVRSMFLDEARLAARLRHSNVVEVLDLGEQGDVVYQVMPLIEGDSLAGLSRAWKARDPEARLPLGVLIRILVDTCRGMHAAHEMVDDDGMPVGLVHRDVSPQNILVGLDGTAKIADFGIAKVLGRLVEETDAGQFRGKMSYLSPEQANRKELDRRSDVFATGIVLWEALTNDRLFRSDDAEETLQRVRGLEIRDPRVRVPDLPPAIAAVTMRALARDPLARYQTAEAMADALEGAARDAGVVSSSKDVAALVLQLAGPLVEERRRAMRRGATAGTLSAPIAPAPARVLAADETREEIQARRGPTRVRLVLSGALLAAVTIAAVGIWQLRTPSRGAVSATVVSRAPEAAASVPSPSPAASSIPGTSPPEPATLTAIAPFVPGPAPRPSASARASVPSRGPAPPKPDKKPRPPFSNPY